MFKFYLPVALLPYPAKLSYYWDFPGFIDLLQPITTNSFLPVHMDNYKVVKISKIPTLHW